MLAGHEQQRVRVRDAAFLQPERMQTNPRPPGLYALPPGEDTCRVGLPLHKTPNTGSVLQARYVFTLPLHIFTTSNCCSSCLRRTALLLYTLPTVLLQQKKNLPLHNMRALSAALSVAEWLLDDQHLPSST